MSLTVFLMLMVLSFRLGKKNVTNKTLCVAFSFLFSQLMNP
jgi:hypothetical protein